MLNFILRRCLLALAVALAVSILTFGLLRLSGDTAHELAGANATAADVQKLRKAYGLDKPLWEQYGQWAGRVARGDLGRSMFFDQPVSELIATRLPVTMTLGAASLLLAIVVSIPLGILAAVRPNGWLDRMALGAALVGQALPTFWFGLILIVVFGVHLQWLPVSGSDTWRHFVLPCVTLAYFAMPALMRLTRAGMLDVLGADYIRTARAKGLRGGTVIFKHALRNAVVPVVSVSAVQLGFMLGGSIVVESIFALHGLGYLGWESVQRSDFPVVQAIVLVLSLTFVLLTLLADILNAQLDPRMRTEEV
ncbi:MAG: ABC transporter permease [Ottowia sp.]|uniref:ABC transporter permease n=1 Tax=Ottowia sp. TaxID=1898956 RepID=UPI003C70F253